MTIKSLVLLYGVRQVTQGSKLVVNSRYEGGRQRKSRPRLLLGLSFVKTQVPAGLEILGTYYPLPTVKKFPKALSI